MPAGTVPTVRPRVPARTPKPGHISVNTTVSFLRRTYDPSVAENSRQILTIRHPPDLDHLGEPVRRSTSTVRRACAVGTTIALVGLTTGLGIMTASAASAATEPDASVSAPATTGTSDTTSNDTGTTTPGTGTGTGTDTGSGTPDGAPSTGGTTGGTGGDEAPAGGTDGSTADPAAGTPDVGDPGTVSGGIESPGDATTAPASAPGTADDQPTKSVRVAAAPSATITGDLTVGSQLVAEPEGFTSGSKSSYLWTDESGATLSESAAYTIDPALAGQQITVTVEGSVAGESATAKTETAVAPVFLDEDGQPDVDGEDGYVDATAGEAFTHTFRALSTPAPTLSITWFDDEDDEPTTAPAGVRFNPETGVLSGTLTDAEKYYSFDVTATTKATSGTVTNDLYGQISVEAAAPAGIEVLSIDKDALLAGTATSAWIIHPNGDVYTQDILGDADPVKGGHVSVAQGGTLLVGGSKVDRFGNTIYPDIDDETDEPVFFTPTVTSDVASDVIASDSDLGEVGYVSVTFPHASTHTLTVSGAGVPSTSFAVDVRPAAVPTVVTPVKPAAVAVHHTGAGRLAYTGTDATSALPWALGLVLAGAGLIGARTLRRRHAQR